MKDIEITAIVQPVIEHLKENNERGKAAEFLRRMGECNSIEQIKSLAREYVPAAQRDGG